MHNLGKFGGVIPVLFIISLLSTSIGSASITQTELTNQYWDLTGATRAPGEVTATCDKDTDCVGTNANCYDSNTKQFSDEWVCYLGKWDKCDYTSDGYTLGSYQCNRTKYRYWYNKTRYLKTNEYWDDTGAGAAPGIYWRPCEIQTDCLSADGESCVSTDNIYFTNWICHNGRWDRCDSTSENITFGNYTCNTNTDLWDANYTANVTCSSLAQSLCEAATHCFYNALNSSCQDNPDTPNCDGLSQTQCDATSGCFYDGSNCFTNCTQLDSSQCQITSGCTYNTGSSQCEFTPEENTTCNGLSEFLCTLAPNCNFNNLTQNCGPTIDLPNCTGLTQLQCILTTGCTYENNSCQIECNQLTENECDSTQQCVYDTQNQTCGDSGVPDCDGLNQTTCDSTSGCAFNGTACNTDCGTLSNTQCDAADNCFLSNQTGDCQQTPDLPDCDGLNLLECAATTGCSYNGTGCNTDCSSLAQTQCEVETNCYYSSVTGTCKDTPDLPDCAGLPQVICESRGGCAYNWTACNTDCTELTQSQCEAETTCTFNAITGSCQDKPDLPDCAGLNQTTCDSTSGCAFNGTACNTDCTSLSQTQCELVSACLFEANTGSCVFDNYTVGEVAGLNITYNTNGTLTLSWNASANATSYNVYYTNDACGTSFNALSPQATGVTNTNWTDATASASGQRIYRVAAVKGAEVRMSNAAAGKWDINLTSGYNFISLPVKPSNTNLKPFNTSILSSLNSGTDFGPAFSGSYELVFGPVEDGSATLGTFNPKLPPAIPQNFNTLTEKISIQIKMKENDTLTVVGILPVTTDMRLNASDYFWVGYPACTNNSIKPFASSPLSSLHAGSAIDYGTSFDGSYKLAMGPVSVGSPNLGTFNPKLPPAIPQNLKDMAPRSGYILQMSNVDTFSVEYA